MKWRNVVINDIESALDEVDQTIYVHYSQSWFKRLVRRLK